MCKRPSTLTSRGPFLTPNASPLPDLRYSSGTYSPRLFTLCELGRPDHRKMAIMKKRLVASQIVLALIASLIVTISSQPAANAVATACDNGSAAQNGITVLPSQGKAFYIDSGQNQNIDASYVGYRVKSASARQGLWVKLDSFTGGVVSLANPLDSEYALKPLSGTDTQTAFFLLKATSATNTAQKHVVTVYDGRPEAGNVLYSCTYTFSRVSETIKANPNKVDSISIGTVPGIGGTLTVSVLGNTGTIGAGKTPDFDSMWMTPAAVSSFPTRAMRLEKVETLFDNVTNLSLNDNCGAGNKCFTDQLLVPGLRTVYTDLGGSGAPKMDYWIKYTFRVIGAAPSFQFKPIAQISSGTQMKHTPMDSFNGQAVQSVNLSTVTVSNITTSKVVNTTTSATLTTTGSGSSTMLQVPYRVTVTNTGSAALTLDQVLDLPNSAVNIDTSFTPTVSYFSTISGGSASSTSNLAIPTKNSKGEISFTGPFTVANGGRIEINYRMLIPQCPTGSGVQSYSNSAYSLIGGSTVGSSTAGYQISASVQSSCSSPTSVTSIPTPTEVRIPTDAVTYPATSIANTSATMNGTADSNGVSGQAISFEWGTTSALGSTASGSPGTTTTSTTPVSVSANLTGLTAGTLYYFRIKVGSVYGEILTFVTTQPVSAPTVTTDAPTNVSATNATLNSTVDANLTPVYVEFDVWRTNDTVTVRVTDDPSIAFHSTNNPYTEISGAFPTAISLNMTDFGLSGWIASGVTIYYRARVITVSGTTPTNAVQTQQFTMTTYNPQVITFNAISDITYGDSAPSIAPTSDSGMTITYGSSTPDVCTVNSSGAITILKVGTCTITADQSGGLKGGTSTYYEAAEQKVQSFEVTQKAITITAAAKSKYFGDTDPSFTYTITSGSLIGSDTITGTMSRAAGESLGTYLISRNTLTPGSNYAVTYVSANLTINAKVITVTAAPKSKVFGTNDPALTFTHTPALLAGDTFTGTISRNSGQNVGQYSIIQNTLALPAGYQLIFVGDTLTVTAKPLTISADSKSKNAGGSTPTFTFHSIGLSGSDAVGSVTYNFSSGSYSSSTTPPTADGAYTTTPSAAVFSTGSASNYTITYETATYTITSLQNQILTWTTIGNKTYGNSATGAVVSNRSLTPVTIVSNTPSICTVPNGSSSGATITLVTIGICELKASQPGDSTYGPATDTIESFTVLAAPLVITASSPTGIRVGDAIPTITASYSGFVNSQNSSVLTTLPTCVTSYTTSSASGAVETTSCSGAAATNYTISYVAGSITVAAANNGNNNNPAPTPTPIVKQKTTINWSNPTPIFAGTPLGGSELNAIFSVPGTCVYSPAAGTVLPEGNHTLSVTCTPTDGVNFEPMTATVTIQVKAPKKKATILWFNPSPITNPAPLGGVELNAKGSVPGNLEYTPGPGTVLPPGSHVLSVKLKPTDPNIDEVEAKVTIFVRTKPADPKNPTPSTPGTTPIPEVKEPAAPTKPAREAAPAAIPAARNNPVLQTAGKPAEVITVTPNEAQTGVIVSAPDWSLAISSTTKFVQGNTADSSARVVIEKGNTVTTSGTGFKPFSQVDVYVYSTPTWLGAVITDAFGNFTTTLPMPAALPEGDHTFQAEGLTPDDLERKAAVPITLIPAVAIAKPGQLRFEVYFGMNSVVITKAEAAKIAKNVKSVLSNAAANAKITVKVVGWVQPNPKPGNIKYLSTNRAKNVAAMMKKLGLKGSYSLNFPGLDKDNIPSARHATVTISWSLTKSSSA